MLRVRLRQQHLPLHKVPQVPCLSYHILEWVAPVLCEVAFSFNVAETEKPQYQESVGLSTMGSLVQKKTLSHWAQESIIFCFSIYCDRVLGRKSAQTVSVTPYCRETVKADYGVGSLHLV